MTKVLIASLGCMLFFAACSNNNSSTVGTYENEESSASEVKNENTSNEKNINRGAENVQEVSADTSKNITGITKDSIVFQSKKDTGTLADKTNVKVQKTKKIDSALQKK